MKNLIRLPLFTLSLFCLVCSIGLTQDSLVSRAPSIDLLQEGVQLTLLAEQPDLMTPTGIDVDDQGRIWLISSHTHFRPEGYDGPKSDEVLVFDKNGKDRQVFYNKTEATMHLKLGPDGWVYLAERDRILRIKDTDGNGQADVEETLASLDTVADYPHNGLSGMAWHPDGGLVFSLGENFGKDWILTGTDSVKLSGRGEGGIFWCTPTGTKMRRVAQGFWNPFGLLVRSDSEIFAAENDPGSRPPCRLLSIVEGADYGFQWVYGSAAIHPFVAWNGELRGTLGMVHPCGEGPCAVLDLGGGVLIPSWSNHCIDYYPLKRKGAGYTSERIELVRGSDFFRPVCMAQGPDGAFYMTDWVDPSYQLHKQGRLWRVDIDKNASWVLPQVEPLNPVTLLARKLREGTTTLDEHQLFELARGNDPYLSDAALTALARSSSAWTSISLQSMPIEHRVWAIVALRRVNIHESKWVRALVGDKNKEIRFETLRWIADGVLTEFLPEVEKMLSDTELDYRLFEAAIATWNTLRGKPEAGVTDAEVLLERITYPSSPSRIKAFALRLAPSNHSKLSIELLRSLFSAGDSVLSQEVVRTLSAQASPESFQLLGEIAADRSLPNSLRADAISGLASSTDKKYVSLLCTLASQEMVDLQEEALRALRNKPIDEDAKMRLIGIVDTFTSSLVAAVLDASSIKQDRPNPEDTDEWLARFKSDPRKPDVAAGRRIFHSKVGMCSSCHRYEGRGNVVGPDLSLIALQGTETEILRSILEPHRSVAPQYYTTLLELSDGEVFSGILLRSSSTEVYRDSQGNERTFQKSEILRRKESNTSMMPTGLIDQLTDRDIQDLLAFLTHRSP